MLKLFSLLLCSFGLCAHKFEVSVALIFQNEALYLKEWIEFHKLVGVEHFYLYNNNSTDGFSEILEPYVKEGVVELIAWPEKAKSRSHWMMIQRNAMRDATTRACGVTKWLAFIDADELIVPVQDGTLNKFLKDRDDCKAIGINWQLFGTSHIAELDKNLLMIEQLVYKAPPRYSHNHFVKSIVQPSFVDLDAPLEEWNAHTVPLIGGAPTVNANKKPITALKRDLAILVDKIRINHYIFRDENFFHNTKLKRADSDPVKTHNLKMHAEASNEVLDLHVLVYADELRNKVFE